MDPKSILITGASSGFGRLAAEQLVRRGHRVLAGIRGGEERLRSLFPTDLLATGRLFATDLHMELPESIEQAARGATARFDGRLDVLINNAGYGLLAPFEKIPDESMLHQMQVNCLGPLALTRHLLPALRETRGRVLNVTSIVGVVSLPFYSAYNASKFALEGASEALYYELKPFGIQVGLIEPGGFRTDFARTSIRSASAIEPGPLYRDRLEAFNRYLSGKSAGGDPRKVAGLLVRLSECRRVPIRSVVGADAWAGWLARKLVPENLRVRASERVFRNTVFGE